MARPLPIAPCRSGQLQRKRKGVFHTGVASHPMQFDRLIRTMDEWARDCRQNDVFAQIGESAYQPRHLSSAAFLDPETFRKHVQAACGIVSHAGTGTILAVLQLGKLLLVLPRHCRLKKTRSDHQIPTATYFAARGCILAARDESELGAKLNDLKSFHPCITVDGHASPALVQRLREFVQRPS